MNYLLDEDETVREARISKAMDFAVRKYSQERLLKDMERLYLELVGRSTDEGA